MFNCAMIGWFLADLKRKGGKLVMSWVCGHSQPYQKKFKSVHQKSVQKLIVEIYNEFEEILTVVGDYLTHT